MTQISSLFVRKMVAAASPSLDKPWLLRKMGVDPDAPLDFNISVSESNHYDLLRPKRAQ